MFSRRKLSYKRRRRRLPVLVLFALVLVAAYVAVRTSDGGLLANIPGLSGNNADSNSQQTPSRSPGEAGSDDSSAKEPAKLAPKESAPDPEQPTPEAAAYAVIAPELPGTTPESIKGVYRSKINKSWASVRFEPEGEGKPFVVFTHWNGKSWRAEKSVRADEPDYAKNDVVPLAGVPDDLIQYLYSENVFAAKVPEPTIEKMDLKHLPDVDGATFSSTEPVMDGVPDADRERIENVLGEARKEIEGYHGIAGLYVRDLEGDFGYGIRPDEKFFTASIIKVPIMVAVYRKVDEGDLSFSQEVEIKDEDWAAGAGWLQWEKAGTKQTVGDLLLLMMTQSDNVAANALVRMVGGPEHVNEVARSMGAEDTLVYQKISSERGAVPAIDNRSTPHDMATMMQQIAEGKAASEKSCGYMIDLMHEDKLDWWLDAGLPEDVDAANKAGWLYRVYDEVGIVEHDGHRYVIAILSKHGSADVYEGQDMIKNLSQDVWESQTQEN
ncbi:MAG: serine hydrolase [Rubrobacteraceae bacterium]|nr:serine hydrolase [Rubrobacteraceae bacterium]